MKRFSKKRARENRKYLALRKKFLEQNPICEFEGCEAEATECHHSEGRIGKRLLDTRKFKALCNYHHRWAELNPVEAKEKGLSGSRLSVLIAPHDRDLKATIIIQ